MESRRRREWHHASACIPCGLIPYDTSCRFHTLASQAIPCRNKLRILYAYGVIKENGMKKNPLLEYSEQLAICIVDLCRKYNIDSNTVYQIKKSSSSVFANITEAQYPQSLADMHSKFEIARKECAETESWLKLLYSTGVIDEATFKEHRNLCGRIKRMLTASCITIENKLKRG